MQLPTIHLNGTPRYMLVAELSRASRALDEAYQALKETAPNGRDYYPQGPEAMEAATREHMDRLGRLDAIKKEVDALALAIDKVGR